MAILFMDKPTNSSTILVRCPSCKSTCRITPKKDRSFTEVCPHCCKIYTVQAFKSGMVVVD